MAYILTTEAEIQQKSGANVNVGFDTTAMTASNLRAESSINCITRRNWSDDFAGLNEDVKQLLSEYCSSFVAIEAISFDMSGYSSLGEAESMITILRDGMLRSSQILKIKAVESFIDVESP